VGVRVENKASELWNDGGGKEVDFNTHVPYISLQHSSPHQRVHFPCLWVAFCGAAKSAANSPHRRTDRESVHVLNVVGISTIPARRVRVGMGIRNESELGAYRCYRVGAGDG
jgi:hypothetical protein